MGPRTVAVAARRYLPYMAAKVAAACCEVSDEDVEDLLSARLRASLPGVLSAGLRVGQTMVVHHAVRLTLEHLQSAPLPLPP